MNIPAPRSGIYVAGKLDVLNGQIPCNRVKFEAIQDVYARAERGQRNVATSEAEPHARRSEAQPR
jgi:hypothetical protein